MKNKISIIFFICLPFLLRCQEEAPRKWELSGYQKSLQGILVFEDPNTQKDTLLTNIFLHNRLNFKWFPNNSFTLRAELRTRYFFGTFHRSDFNSNFKQQLKEASNDYLNLQLIDYGSQTVLHSVFDRLYLKYEKNEWEVSVGRQRINWGIGSVWNPHDIFNTFSFLDFDYEERPGVDAVHITRYIGYSGGIELAVKAADSWNDFVAGLRYKVNKWNYDFQVIGGFAKQDLVLGVGWAGAIKNVGFKGEISYFLSTLSDRKDGFSSVLEMNYAFAKGTILSTGLLYNASDNSDTNLFAFQLEARNLYPFHWAITSTVVQPITPLFQGSISMVYSPVKGHPLFISPDLTYSIAQNVDVDLIVQIFFEGLTKAYKARTKLFYLRIKWSF